MSGLSTVSLHQPCMLHDSFMQHGKDVWISMIVFGNLNTKLLHITALQGMEALQASGKVKSIGVSNFNILQLKRLLALCRVPPAVNQVLHIVPVHSNSLVLSFIVLVTGGCSD